MPLSPSRKEPSLVPGGDSGVESVSDQSAASPELPETIPQSSFLSEVAVAETPPRWDQDGGGEPPSPPGAGEGGGGGGEDEGGDEPEPPGMGRMSFMEHLEELRKRLFYSLIALAVGVIVSWSYADNIYAGLAHPLTSILRELKMDDKLVYTNPTSPFNLYIKLSMLAGVFLSSPFLTYQAWKFISPGLYRDEKKYAVPFILFCSTLFLSGGAFAYYIAFPAALHFLLEFGHQFRPFITVDEYFSLASTIILGLACVFELPVLILFLTLFRLMTPGFLLRNFRYAFLLIVILAAAVTPTSDVVNMMIFAAPLVVLYFMGIGLSYLVLWGRKRKAG